MEKMTMALARKEVVSVVHSIKAMEVVNEWLAECRSENTRQAYGRDIVDFCKTVYRTGDVQRALQRFFSLSEIEAGMTLTRFKQLLRERGAKPSTINRKLSGMRALIDHARRRGVVHWRVSDLVKGEKERTDVTERVKMRLPAATVEGLTEAIERLFAILPKRGVRALRDRSIVALMALHGLRRVEIVRLSLADLVEGDEVTTIRVWGKGDKFRTIPLRPDTTRLLKNYLAALRRAGIAPVADALGVPIFVSLRKCKGKRLTLRQVNGIVDRALTLAGLKRQSIGCHSLRHVFATLTATKVPLPDLAAYLGHSSIATTGIYAHALNSVNPSMAIKVKVL